MFWLSWFQDQSSHLAPADEAHCRNFVAILDKAVRDRSCCFIWTSLFVKVHILIIPGTLSLACPELPSVASLWKNHQWCPLSRYLLRTHGKEISIEKQREKNKNRNMRWYSNPWPLSLFYSHCPFYYGAWAVLNHNSPLKRQKFAVVAETVGSEAPQLKEINFLSGSRVGGVTAGFCFGRRDNFTQHLTSMPLRRRLGLTHPRQLRKLSIWTKKSFEVNSPNWQLVDKTLRFNSSQ